MSNTCATLGLWLVVVGIRAGAADSPSVLGDSREFEQPAKKISPNELPDVIREAFAAASDEKTPQLISFEFELVDVEAKNRETVYWGDLYTGEGASCRLDLWFKSNAMPWMCGVSEGSAWMVVMDTPLSIESSLPVANVEGWCGQLSLQVRQMEQWRGILTMSQVTQFRELNWRHEGKGRWSASLEASERSDGPVEVVVVLSDSNEVIESVEARYGDGGLLLMTEFVDVPSLGHRPRAVEWTYTSPEGARQMRWNVHRHAPLAYVGGSVSFAPPSKSPASWTNLVQVQSCAPDGRSTLREMGRAPRRSGGSSER